ncbi:hypothetical protein M3O75_17205 [Klebsiella pneumoniae]|nr:hypothetical protein [Klebsiella pneumoniae]
MDSFIELFAVSPLVLVVLFFVAILAGFIDSLAGAGLIDCPCADGGRHAASPGAGDQ